MRRFNDHVHHVYLQLLPLFQSDDLKEGMLAFNGKARNRNSKENNHTYSRSYNYG